MDYSSASPEQESLQEDYPSSPQESFQEDNSSAEQEPLQEDHPSFLRTQKKLQIGAEPRIDEWFDALFVKDKFLEWNLSTLWTVFVNMQNSFDCGVYIVAKCFEKTAQEPQLEETVLNKIFENLVYDYKRCPTWRKWFKSYYDDIIDVEKMAKLVKLPEEEQERIFHQLRYGHRDDSDDSDEGEPEVFYLPGYRHLGRKPQDYD